ncbi:glycoside hydrolase family 13 protein [Chryseobacterium sp. PS-8]|uniref:Glycoside hydrolase family 13 protein n=1 Tax=Chryseobacterium indicum TaxID=2766954 RepID=A0ABS9C703_9FLAO|nr:glycoside hydrolase family 13 protein [Chryseobacterium sp. PS-8]MCF2220330.1 glycoside hydrolase family 13 protein [Chryseobacterium sp. PS-8]
MKKDLMYISHQKDIEKVHIGFFPVKGRYFRTEMKSRGNGLFELTTDLPKGRSFFHYFLNENFEKPLNNNGTMISQYDALKRSPVVFETEIFCPLQFENSPVFFSHIINEEWEIRAITHQQWIENVSVVIDENEFNMSKQYSHKNKIYWSCRMQLNEDEIDYCIKISGSKQVKYLHEKNFLEDKINNENLMKINLSEQKNCNANPILNTGYQIFPDRFLKKGDCLPNVNLKEWGDLPDYTSFFGGTIQGIIEKLDYISSLGTDFIYVNPIFLSGSYHRYDCVDYMKIDPLLGTEEDFALLIEEMEKRNMKLILDISLNHCNRDFFAFKDICKNGENSKYLDWFEIYNLPLKPEEKNQYSCWHGYHELPQFNLANHEVRSYFKDIIRYWMNNFQINGWRLDVCTEIPDDFIKIFTDEVKAINPQALIIAENWHNTSSVFSSESGIDGFTNYSLYLDIMIPFFVQENLSLKTMCSKILEMNYSNSSKVNRLSWNFLSNHDLPRFSSIIKDEKKYNMAFALLYSLPGTPVIYYGEETKMLGLGDPLNRGCMKFASDAENEDFIKLLQDLNDLRKDFHDIFNYGSFFFPVINNKEKKLIVRRSLDDKNLAFCFNFDNISHEFILDSDKKNAIVVEAKSFEVVFYENSVYHFNSLISGTKKNKLALLV